MSEEIEPASQEKEHPHFMGWQCKDGYSVYKCLSQGCGFIDMKETFKDWVRKEALHPYI